MGLSKEEYDSLSPEEKKAYRESLLGTVPRAGTQGLALVTREWPHRPAQWIAAFLGLPVERQAKQLLYPLTIYSFIFIFLAVQLLSMGPRNQEFVESWGFTPAFFYSHFFLTMITSFFIHGGWMHLLGNAYYFYIFGDDVESDMSFMSFLALLFGGHVFGIILHGLLTADSHIPLVGASAGISALMGYYMVRFPKRQISYMLLFFYVWIHIPAFWALLWKFGWELMLAGTDVGMRSGVALWAHVGGAFFGAGFALFSSRPKVEPR